MAPQEPLSAPTVLVVDDELELRTLLNDYFTHHGLSVRTAPDASAARSLIAESVPSVVVLDLNMPGEHGLDLARWLRAAHPGMGLIMLTTQGASVDRVVGLEVGADDYVPKPFEPRELLARVRSVLRRVVSGGAGGDEANSVSGQAANRVRFGACTLDIEARRLYAADGSHIEISAAEFDLLAMFARNPDRPMNRDQIMEQAHNRGWDVYDRSIDLRVMRLRRKIEQNPDRPEIIKTVRSVGYVFVSRPAGPAA